MKSLIYSIALLLSLNAYAQNISGLYSGTLLNDSTKAIQNYELALSEYKGKITGYSYLTFTINDTFYYGIRKIKATKKEGKLVVEDDKMLANNFPESPAKGVKKITTFILPPQDSIINLNGNWKTTQTKNYYSLSGSATMAKDKDSTQSQLIQHLIELHIISPNTQPTNAVATNNNKAKIKSPTNVTASTVLPFNERIVHILQTIAVSSDSLVISFYDNGVVDGDTISVLLNGKVIIAKQMLTERAVKKTINFDTPADSILTLTLVAENLGTIPPNTGLLVVQDGDEKHQINFSADMQTNAAIVFKKKKSL